MPSLARPADARPPTARPLPASSAPAAVTRISTTVDIRCAAIVLHQSADWHFPAGTPKGLVWLQHGFSRANEHVRDLAGKYAEAGYLVFAPTLPSANIFGCTLQNLGDNTGFLDNVADLFGKAGGTGDRLGSSFADARNRAGRPGLALPQNKVFVGHSAGGEAALYVAQRVRSAYPAAWAGTRGLVLLDPVRSFIGTNTTSSLNHLDNTSLPIHTISSPGYLCNNGGSGTQAVQAQLHRPFVGVRLTSGAHTDAEGASTDRTGTLACGTPQAKNVAALQTLAVGWARDAFTGGTTPDLYPGGAYYQGLLSSGTAQTLTGAQ
ncbi:alpha/beta hydrolase [Actinomadura sp. J1-007]|nr:alpha/beta hydrolase [Actinomadura sp. J1-007]